MFITYGLLAAALAVAASIAFAAYVWVALPAAGAAILVAGALSSCVGSRLRGRVGLTESLMEDLESGGRNGNIGGYFLLLMLLPLVQFLVLAQMRLLDGYGYFESLYLTAVERHLRAYLGTLEFSIVHWYLLVGMLV
mmetsp:Transcript_148462/g.458747  ORF Transcript_148462/g.458747 Transcript_148462/m.458747 type:complete len:137 (-) Transcript_148462:17-427(-)